jgi:predicted glycosyltransferase
MCILASKVRGIPSIHFTDNDITAHVEGLQVENLYNYFEAQATYNFVPEAFSVDELTRWGADPDQIVIYEGYKEDIYVAEFERHPSFTEGLPFENYIVVRPEALGAAYVDAECSIVPELFKWATDSDIPIVYLPRGRGDEEYAKPYESDQVYTPERALNGLQLIWHSSAVLTGSGTMAREAACMSIPAISFFPTVPLSVDQQMIREDKIFHSRDPSQIVSFVKRKWGTNPSGDISESKERRDDIVKRVKSVLDNYE